MEKEGIKRILDANANRAVEGLRVLEEITRFILEDEKTTEAFKKLRFKVRSWVKTLIPREPHFIGRNIKNDIGKELYTESEAKRKTIIDVFLANSKRVQEAIRVLEEFSKLINPHAGKVIKNIRFKIYELEKKIYYLLKRRSKLNFDLYVVTDPIRNHIAIARAAKAGGVRAIQLRDKQASKADLLKWAKKIMQLTHKSDLALIINDYPEIALKSNADGVHLGQEDLRRKTIKKIRLEIGEDKIIGVSVASIKQAVNAQRQGVDYIAVGPIFPTLNKPGANALGLRLLEKMVNKVKVPVVAIGGINKDNLGKVLKTGCRRVAVISAVLNKRDMEKAIKQLRGRFKRLQNKFQGF